MYSPVVFFAFNRPYHTNEALKSLIQNEISIDTEIFAFIDGPRNNSELHLIDNVEKIIKSYSCNFKKMTINRSSENLSSPVNKRLAISNIFSNFESIIVLEDDVCVSKYFLEYMNKALKRYKNIDKVWHINGFNYPNNSNLYKNTFFTRSMQFWGWGTWKDKWLKFKDDPLAHDPFYLIKNFDKKKIKKFNLDTNHDINWCQVIANAEGKLANTMDIFWEAYIFMNKGLCLSPQISLTRNIGHDGSGINCKIDKQFRNARINHHKINSFPKEIIEDQKGLKDIQKFINKKYSLINRILNKLNLFYSNFKKIFFNN